MAKKLFFTAAALLVVSGLVFGQGDESGLSKQSVFETPVPEPVGDERGDPGEEPLLPRPYATSPPLVPHAIVDMLPITRSENLCLDCHLLKEKEEGEPTPVPESHYVDLRNAPDKAGDTIAGARYNCVFCHVAPTRTELLVANDFARPLAADSTTDTEGGDPP